ncbi:spore coat protein [Fredinandcohnia sp. QZ13]|uniref:spore coat protein n=1 Tax=Fredinandcohnia sp. QZ13 TaxID=3073144 RepID=UPI0028534EBA|nr:spore coat protein [Fredinandcohnia sp. QZ13]MDR4889470.1 spore coat protein [Fredinandcohnia sp. QZ13]
MNQQMNQNQNQVKNPKTSVPKTPQMNDRDFINDMLATEKYMTAAYSTALNEMSHDGLYEDIRSIFNETQDCQRELYNLMFKNGWYKLEEAETQKVQQKLQQFYNYTTTQFPDHNTVQ